MADSAIGTVKVLTFEVRDEDGNLYDAPDVRAESGSPDDEDLAVLVMFGTDDEITNPSPGVYRVEVTCDASGDWGCRLECRDDDGNLLGAIEKYWRIAPSRIIPDE